MAKFDIERGIEIPGLRSKIPYRRILDSLEVGDSVLMPNRNAANHLASQFYSQGKRGLTRTVEGGVRVWRIK